MESKRMRFSENPHLPSHNKNDNIELRIFRNICMAECIDDNYINKLLESTRDIISQQRSAILEHNRLENAAINQAITSFGLKKSSFSDDDDDDDNSADTASQLFTQAAAAVTASTSSHSPSTSNSSSSGSSLEDFAIQNAIQIFGLQKKKDGGGGDT